jgi:hypothetical protein
MQERFAELGIGPVSRFRAIDGARVTVPPAWGGPAGAYGCLLSNVALVEDARRQSWPSILIFEDDVGFDPAFVLKFPRFFEQVPSDWDMLFFGGMHRSEPIPVSPNVVRLTGTTSTYAYAVRETAYDAFIALNAGTFEPVDVTNLELQRRLNCYCFLPHLAWADADYSDTHGRSVNPWWLKESLVLGGNEMNRIQRASAAVILHRDRTPDARGVRNLRFIADHYHQFLAGIATVVVEQDTVSTVGSGDLPNGCFYLLLEDGGPIDRIRCFKAALDLLGSERDYFFLVDRDICCSWDLKAALKKCLDHDFVGSFSRVFDLDERDTERVINSQRIDTSRYAPRPPAGLCSEFSVFTRDAIEEVGLGGDHWVMDDEALARRVNERLRVFETPGWTLRLNGG